MGDIQYNVIAFPYVDATSLLAIEAELLDRWGPLRAIEGVAFAAEQDTVANLQTLGGTRNSQFVSILGLESFPGMPSEHAAQVAGIVAFYGSSDVARPFQTLKLSGLAPAEVDRLTLEERNLLLADGISTLTTGPGGSVMINRLVTTRTKNDAGFVDTAFRDVNDVLQLGFYRYSWVARMSTRFPRHRLAEKISATADGGQDVLTPMGAKAESIAHYGEVVSIGVVQDPEFFADNSRFEISATDPNRLDCLLAPRLTGQARIMAAKVQFRE
jgi:phage tail sheath gpL-like